MKADGLVPADPLAEIVPFKHASNGELRRKPDDLCRCELLHPRTVPDHLGLCALEDPERLLFICSRVTCNLVGLQYRPCLRSAAGITDSRLEVADQKYLLMTELFKVPDLPHDHRVSQVQ